MFKKGPGVIFLEASGLSRWCYEVEVFIMLMKVCRTRVRIHKQSIAPKQLAVARDSYFSKVLAVGDPGALITPIRL
jgi:hypothetical protein